jgi:hypothetical protein
MSQEGIASSPKYFLFGFPSNAVELQRFYRIK